MEKKIYKKKYCEAFLAKVLDQITVDLDRVLWLSSIYSIDSGHLG